MFRRLPALATLALAFGLAACGSANTPNLTNPPVIQLPGSATSLAISGATSTQFSVSETGYTGTFSATSSNPAVATVTPATVQSSSGARAAQSDRPEAGNQGAATFTITTLQNGTATITVTDQNGGSKQFTVTVTGISAAPSPSPSPSASPSSAPSVIASPTAATFTAAGQTQSVSVTESGYTGSFSAVSSNTTVVMVSPASGTAFTVTAVAAGTASITFTDTRSGTTSVSVIVTTSSGTISSHGRQ